MSMPILRDNVTTISQDNVSSRMTRGISWPDVVDGRNISQVSSVEHCSDPRSGRDHSVATPALLCYTEPAP